MRILFWKYWSISSRLIILSWQQTQAQHAFRRLPEARFAPHINAIKSVLHAYFQTDSILLSLLYLTLVLAFRAVGNYQWASLSTRWEYESSERLTNRRQIPSFFRKKCQHDLHVNTKALVQSWQLGNEVGKVGLGILFFLFLYSIPILLKTWLVMAVVLGRLQWRGRRAGGEPHSRTCVHRPVNTHATFMGIDGCSQDGRVTFISEGSSVLLGWPIVFKTSLKCRSTQAYPPGQDKENQKKKCQAFLGSYSYSMPSHPSVPLFHWWKLLLAASSLSRHGGAGVLYKLQ